MCLFGNFHLTSLFNNFFSPAKIHYSFSELSSARAVGQNAGHGGERSCSNVSVALRWKMQRAVGEDSFDELKI
jgi:hypothetical protein